MKRTEDGHETARGKPIRVLHVVHQLARGGVEGWLMALASHVDHDRFHVDVMVHTDKPQPYDGPIRERGWRVIPCLRPTEPWRYAFNFFRIVAQWGPYDVIHAHCHHWNGFVLWLARRAGIRSRLPHSRVQAAMGDLGVRPDRWVYRVAMRAMIHRCATRGFAVSSEAACGLYGRHWRGDGRWQILRSAIDLDRFERPPLPVLPPTWSDPTAGPVVASIARFDPQKNHRFLLAVFESIARVHGKARFLLIGSGPLEKRVRSWIDASWIRDRVCCLGERDDVPSLLCHCIDLLVMPSIVEGLPRASLEAQAAGVAVLMSDTITREAAVEPSLVHWASLGRGPAFWADLALRVVGSAVDSGNDQPLAVMRASAFNITTNARSLERVYEECVASAGSDPVIPQAPSGRGAQRCVE